MNVELSTWQRAGLIQALGAVRGNVATLRLAFGVLEAVGFTEEEAAEIGYREEGDRATWDEVGAERVWEMDLGKKDAKFAAVVVDRFEGWKAKDAEKVFGLVEELTRITGQDG